MKSDHALIVTAQALSITSQLLAIGIEIGIIAGGYFIFKKVKKELEEEQKPVAMYNQDQVVEAIRPSKPTTKERIEKVKKIWKALTE